MTPRYVRSQRVLWRSTCTGAVLLPPASDEPIALNGTAATLWDLLAEPVDLNELCALLGEIYEQDPRAIVADVRDLLANLDACGAIEGAS